MAAPLTRVVVVGAGLFGLTGARALLSRGWAVTLLDPGPVPHPDAASTDLSKVVRADYGADELYTGLAERAIEHWPAWNERFGERVFHPTGLFVATSAPLDERPFERDTYSFLRSRGHALERLDAGAIARRYPAWRAGRYVDGYFNPTAGWVASGRVIEHLAREVREAGGELVEGAVARRLIHARGRTVGVECAGGRRLEGDLVLVAAGSWTTAIVPWLSDRMWPTAQTVQHFQVSDPRAFSGPAFPVWCADVTRTGWYGFPALADGRMKLANHGPGRRIDPLAPRDVLAGEAARFRVFLAETFPAAAAAPLVFERTCTYCDTADADFWLDHDPDHPGLVVAAGGSGHAFKFAPVLGDLVADACEGRLGPEYARWRWRGPRPAVTVDVMRQHG